MALDKQTKGVLIETRILQLTLNPTFQFGVDWEKKFPVHNFKNLDFNSNFSFPSTTDVPDFGKMSIGEVNRDGFMFEIKAMKEVANTKVLANPRLMRANAGRIR